MNLARLKFNLPQRRGICLTCIESGTLGECRVPEMLESHYTNQRHFGRNYKAGYPGLWEDESIDDPEFNDDGSIKWCPCHAI